jgi:hypothetical protein
MRLPSCNHDENAWKSCFVHMVEVQGHFGSRCRKPCASPTIGRYEKDEQAAEDSNDGSALLGFAFPILESLAHISCHCKAGCRCAAGTARVLNCSGNSNPKGREDLDPVVKSVVLSGKWLQPIRAGVRPGFMGNCSDWVSMFPKEPYPT